ncbi:MAG: hypothetical protein FGF48_02045 [Candidatus Brockarchaeota archaeon]|nr:hypothetical protein [Candidatus Brockarchaeota archaeon]
MGIVQGTRVNSDDEGFGREEITLRRSLNLAQTTFLGVGTAICETMFAIMGEQLGLRVRASC